MIYRRQFIQSLFQMTAPVIFASAGLKAKPETKPNFIVIFTDDLGYGDLSKCDTPHIDRIAKEGAKLTDFTAPAPYCAPSRAAMLTGRYPFRSGMVFNPTPDKGLNETGLPQEEITIAEALKKAGYVSSCIGKWHLGHIQQYLPRKQGFDEYYGILYSNDMRPVQIVENEKVVDYPVVQATLTKRYTQRALDFIRRSKKKSTPFFLYLAHAMPHKPLAASDDFYTPETPDDLYEDVIRELDWSVGQLLAEVKKQELDRETMIIFTSDNGPWYGGSTGGLRGMKARTWEGGLRIPMMARWPGKIPSGVINKSSAGIIDIFPTILTAAGVNLPKDRIIDGKDIFPLFISEKAESPHEALVAMHGTKLMTIRSGKWKLHIYKPRGLPKLSKDWKDERGPDGVSILAPYEQHNPYDHPGLKTGDKSVNMMLFDMENDAAEQKDVSKKYPEIVEKLKKLYDKINSDVPSKFNHPRTSKKLLYIKGGELKYNNYNND